MKDRAAYQPGARFVAYYLVDAGDGVMISASVFKINPALKSQTRGLRIMCGSTRLLDPPVGDG